MVVFSSVPTVSGVFVMCNVTLEIKIAGRPACRTWKWGSMGDFKQLHPLILVEKPPKI